jgi:hypothetical protein
MKRSIVVNAAAAIGAHAHTGVLVRGMAYDSLHSVPLGGAFVSMSGGGKSRSATSDSTGWFFFDDVAPGTYRLSMQHAAIDSLGFPGLSTRAVVTDGKQDILIAIPSFRSMWRSACGGANAPADSGFLFGVVRDAMTQGGVANATIDVSWIDVSMDAEKRVAQKRFRTQARSDAGGSFGVCGVPGGVAVRVQALSDTSASGAIDLTPASSRVQRRDLSIGPVSKTSTARGIVAGTATTATGTPYRDARVALEDLPEVRSGPDGRFVIRNVPAGTRQLEVSAIGMMPVSAIVDVTPKDTAFVSVEIRKVTTLSAVEVRAAARMRDFNRELDERKKAGFGRMMDSTQLNRIATMSTVFSGFAGVKITRKPGRRFIVELPTAAGGWCTPNVWIDKHRGDVDQLDMYFPDQLALVELYVREMTTPTQFIVPGNKCGSIVVWTKAHVQP